MTASAGRLLTNAIIALLEADGLTVGDALTPEGVGWQGAPGASNFEEYVVVFPVTGGYFDGTISEAFADGRPDYIIHAYGATREQCQIANDAVFVSLTTSKPTVAGFTVQHVSPDVEGGAVRDDDVQPPIFFAPTRWRFFVTPSA